ncbi:MAG TPA: flagellar hook-length control protein FliK, partial [Solirubrobacterales bacterium]|nr:flagellar hook-length control protein FliK [Solirubrobacterales bacterium]
PTAAARAPRSALAEPALASTSAAPTAAAAPANAPAPTAAPRTPAPSAPPPSPGASLEATIRLATDQGFSRARLTLRPAELGSVEVALEAREGGVAARVLADTPQAARLLESAGHELRQRLEAQGVRLQALTVAVAGDAAPSSQGERRGHGGPATASAPSPLPDSPDQLPTPTRQIELGGGVLVDVLA